MAKTKAGFLIGACCCGVISLALIVTSYATVYWVTATINQEPPVADGASYAHHGLFSGTLERQVLTLDFYNLYATCSFGNNVCSWSCMGTQEERDDELFQMFSTGTGAFNCPSSASSLKTAYPQKVQRQTSKIDADDFMQAGLWVSTIFFLSFSLATNVVALGVNIYNIFGNPIEVYASTEALPVYYAFSGISTMLALILWGCEFSMYTSNNIAIFDTLVGNQISEAELGWSYYLLIPADLAQLAACSLIYARQYLMNKKESETVIKGDDVNHDANKMMY